MSHRNKGVAVSAKRTYDFGRESELFFDWKYFEMSVIEGRWADAENYLSRFAKVEDNYCSDQIYFEMRKQKYYEALESNYRRQAFDILLKEIVVVAPKHIVGLIKELTDLLMVPNIREKLPKYRDAMTSRRNLVNEIMEIIIQNPHLVGKLKVPFNGRFHRMCRLLNESLNWQRLPNANNEEPNLFMENRNSKASSSLTSSGRTMVWVPATNGRAITDSDDERDSRCQFLKLPTCPEVEKIVSLAYNNMGNSLFALASNGVHAVWDWEPSESNLDGKASVQVSPKLKEPEEGPLVMINDLPRVEFDNPVACFAITKNDHYVISTSGGRLILFHSMSFVTLSYIMSPPPVITCIAIHPEDNNIIALGCDHSTIIAYHVRFRNVLGFLEGHTKRVTGVAFSKGTNILISGGADAQIILWNINGWEKLKKTKLKIQGNELPISTTQVQFHPNQINFLVVHNSQLAIYEVIHLRCVKQWVAEVPMLISQATFSCDGQAVYSVFVNETVAIFDSTNLQIRYRFSPCSYLPQFTSWNSYPISVAAHPQKPAQFAVGFSDGTVLIFEPREPEGDQMDED
ncbi:hypothetical protein VNO78_29168 [Psophocarpus tetragonolobus]|uniref:CTLH domain-containing protein n=1 Tax=Psophocarpus tetragonolobus TaxID=3891 RepID=A0AAN9X0W5_PSOTE